MKNCLSLPSLGWIFYYSQRIEDDEPVYTYTDKYTRHFLGQSMKGVEAFNQYYQSKTSDKIFDTISEESKVRGNKYEIVDEN